jgi:hypothetical protein
MLRLILLVLGLSGVVRLQAEFIESSLRAADRLSSGAIVASRPTTVSLIIPSDSFPASDRSPLLQIRMERVVEDASIAPFTQLFFSKKYISDYQYALQRFFEVVDQRGGGASRSEQMELTSVPSWDSLDQPRVLFFSYLSTGEGHPYLVIRTQYDWEYKGGVHLFSYADAMELQRLLYRFAYDFKS